MTKIEKANFECCIDLLADMITKYGDRVLQEIEQENNVVEGCSYDKD